MNLQKKRTVFRGFYRTTSDHLIGLDYSADCLADYSADATDTAEPEDVFYN